MSQRRLSDEEYKQCYDNICQDLENINWNGHTIGSLLTEDNKFISIEIHRTDTPEEMLHIKAVFSPEHYVMKTTNPILSEIGRVAHQLLAFGITDISDFRWK